MCDLMACSHDNAEQLDRRNYKEKEKNKSHRNTASQFTVLELLKTPSVGVEAEVSTSAIKRSICCFPATTHFLENFR